MGVSGLEMVQQTMAMFTLVAASMAVPLHARAAQVPAPHHNAHLFKRSAQGETRNHNEYLFNDGNHLWGLEDFHTEKEDRRKRQAAETEASDPGDHLFHGAHLWNLEDYHIDSKRKKRSAQPETRDHNEHIFNDGNHLWGLEDFHIEKEERRKRQAGEIEASDPGDHLFHGAHLWNLEDYHIDSKRKKR